MYRAGPVVPLIQVPTELDYLLNDLKNPKNSTPDKQLSYLAHYYPKLKSITNIKLLTSHFLDSPLLFANPNDFTLENSCKISDCFQYIILTKYKISNPSIKFEEFYTAIYETLCAKILSDSTGYWKILSITAGCISSITPRLNYNPYSQYFNVVSKLNSRYIQLFTDSFLYMMKLNLPQSIKEATIVNLIYTNNHLSSKFYIELFSINNNILPELTQILYFSRQGLDKGALLHIPDSYNVIMKNKPVLRSLNKWAFLFAKLTENSKPSIQLIHSISLSLDYIVSFCSNISNQKLISLHQSDKWNLVKYVFFTTIMIFEAVCKVMISGNFKCDEMILMICNQILRSIFHLSFILDKIGTGGFDTYNFVYQSTTNIVLIDNNTAIVEGLIYSLLNEIPVHCPKNAIEVSKLNYFLRLCETLLPSLTEPFKMATLFPLLTSIITREESENSSLEFAHSVMIKNINSSEYNDDIIFPYADKVLSQFPSKLSLSQTSLIIETCIQKSPNFKSLIDLLKFHFSIASYTVLPPIIHHQNDKEVQNFEIVNTRKAGLLSIYIKSLIYIDDINILPILNDIKKQIDSIIGDHDIYTLYDIFWESILKLNKFNTNLGQTSLDWWDEVINSKNSGPKL